MELARLGIFFVRNMKWLEVFSRWQKDEDREPWITHYRGKGFSDWVFWRRTHTDALNCENKNWHLYSVNRPLKAIPVFRGGYFRAWLQLYYPEDFPPTFAELAQLEEIKNHGGIQSIAQNFPKETLLIGIMTQLDIFVLEGMHRCCAVALLAQQQAALDSKIFIALAEHKGQLAYPA